MIETDKEWKLELFWLPFSDFSAAFEYEIKKVEIKKLERQEK